MEEHKFYTNHHQEVWDRLTDEEKERLVHSEETGVILRINEVIRLILQGYRIYEIHELFRNTYKMTRRASEWYVRKAKEFIVADFAENHQGLIAEGMAMRMSLYKQCIETGDLKLALEILKDIARLQGLYADEQKGIGGGRVQVVYANSSP